MDKACPDEMCKTPNSFIVNTVCCVLVYFVVSAAKPLFVNNPVKNRMNVILQNSYYTAESGVTQIFLINHRKFFDNLGCFGFKIPIGSGLELR